MSVKECRIIDIHHVAEITNTKCIIYGTGKYGNKLYSFLKLKGWEKNIISFAVSDATGNPAVIDGIPVKTVGELKEKFAECNVMIAIGIAHAGEVIRLLQGCEVKGLYCVTSEIMQSVVREITDAMKKLPLERNKLFISCYEGMGYRCNCKYIAEKLLKDRYPVKIVWAVTGEAGGDIPEIIKKVTVNTYEYYREFYTSGICISNCGILLFGEKREGQYYINTWHGYGPFKKAQGAVYEDKERLRKVKEINSNFDLFVTGSTFYSQIYRDSFFYEGEIGEWGAPRNDVFFADDAVRDSVYKTFGIPSDKKLVLYAPTFREDVSNSFEQYDLDLSKIVEALNTRFAGEFVMMYRFHHYLHAVGKCRDYYKQGIDATYYPDIQELLAAADVVITDYSSLMWDFSLQRKPVFLYQNDEARYRADRGFYCPVSGWPYPKAHNKEELSDVIRNFDSEKYVRDLDAFLEKYGSCDDGNASARVAARIMKVIEGNI